MRIRKWTAQQSEAIATAARNLDDHHLISLAPGFAPNILQIALRTIERAKSDPPKEVGTRNEAEHAREITRTRHSRNRRPVLKDPHSYSGAEEDRTHSEKW